MARLRYNGVRATLGADLLTAGTTITFTSKLTHAAGDVPTISGSDYLPLYILDANGLPVEIVHLTAYTTGATTGTVTRAQESTTAADRASGLTVEHGLTVADVDELAADGGGGTLVAARAWRSTAQAMATATNVAISFDTESFDEGGLYDPAQPTRMTIQEDGLYDLAGHIRYAAHSTGIRSAGIWLNGSTVLSSTPINNAGSVATGVHTRAVVELVAGDYVELFAYHTAGASLNTDVSGTNIYTWMSAVKIGAVGGVATDAASVAFTPTGDLAATDVQAALVELDTEKATSGHTHTAPAAADVTFTPAGDLASTDVQAALAELDTEKAAAGHAHTLSGLDGAQIKTDADLNVSSAIDTYLPCGLEDFDTAGYHDNVTNNSRITIPAGKGGRYIVTVAMRYGANSTGERSVGIHLNGVNFALAYTRLGVGGSLNNVVLSHTRIIDLVPGDYIQGVAWQNSGSTLVIPAQWGSVTALRLGS